MRTLMQLILPLFQIHTVQCCLITPTVAGLVGEPWPFLIKIAKIYMHMESVNVT